MSNTAENLSPVPTPSIGEAGGSPVPTFTDADEKPKRRKAAKRKAKRTAARRKAASRKPAESSAEEAPRTKRKAAKRKAARRKTTRKSARRSAGRRPAAAGTSDPSIAAVITAKRAELQDLTRQVKQVEKQVGMLEKML